MYILRHNESGSEGRTLIIISLALVLLNFKVGQLAYSYSSYVDIAMLDCLEKSLKHNHNLVAALWMASSLSILLMA